MRVHQPGSHLMRGGRPQVDDWSWAKGKLDPGEAGMLSGIEVRDLPKVVGRTARREIGRHEPLAWDMF